MKTLKLLFVSCITGLRLPLAGLSVWFMFQENWGLAWLSFLVGVSTDVIDGWLARAWEVTTDWGDKADMASDVLMFWVYVPGALWFYREATLALVTDQRFYGTVIMVVAIVACCVILPNWRIIITVFKWWSEKGNFWMGVIPVGLVGCWMAVQTGWWALVVTVIYGVLAIVFNREKIASFI